MWLKYDDTSNEPAVILDQQNRLVSEIAENAYVLIYEHKLHKPSPKRLRIDTAEVTRLDNRSLHPSAPDIDLDDSIDAINSSFKKNVAIFEDNEVLHVVND